MGRDIQGDALEFYPKELRTYWGVFCFVDTEKRLMTLPNKSHLTRFSHEVGIGQLFNRYNEIFHTIFVKVKIKIGKMYGINLWSAKLQHFLCKDEEKPYKIAFRRLF